MRWRKTDINLALARTDFRKTAILRHLSRKCRPVWLNRYDKWVIISVGENALEML